MAGGNGPCGLTPVGEAFAAGILNRLPGLLALGAPSVASYLRLVPSHWAGVYACWGLENREAALRMITGSAGSTDWAANLEVKCLDLTANPYLLLAGLLAAGFDGVAGWSATARAGRRRSGGAGAGRAGQTRHSAAADDLAASPPMRWLPTRCCAMRWGRRFSTRCSPSASRRSDCSPRPRPRRWSGHSGGRTESRA